MPLLEFKTIIVGIDIRPSLFVLITKYMFVPSRVTGTAQIVRLFVPVCVCVQYVLFQNLLVQLVHNR